MTFNVSIATGDISRYPPHQCPNDMSLARKQNLIQECNIKEMDVFLLYTAPVQLLYQPCRNQQQIASLTSLCKAKETSLSLETITKKENMFLLDRNEANSIISCRDEERKAEVGTAFQ